MRRLAWGVSVLALLIVCLLRPSAWAMLLLAVLLGTPPVSWIFLLFGCREVKLQLFAPAVCAKGRKFSLQVEWNRPGRLPMGTAAVVLKVENAVTGEVVRCCLRPAPSASCVLQSVYCGCLRMEVESVYLYDLFGVLSLKRLCEAVRRTLILPDTFPVEIEPFVSYTSLLDSQEYAGDRRGQDRSETFQIREYVPGDQLNLIHWKLSGKQDKLMVRESAFPVDHTMTIFLDRFQGDAPPEQADALMEAVVSVCQGLSEAGILFRACWKEERVRTEDVHQPEDFTTLVGLLLNARWSDQGIVEQELGTGILQAGGRVLYFGTGRPEILEVLEGLASPVHLFLCGKEPYDGPNITVFTPGTVRDDLRELRGSDNR